MKGAMHPVLNRGAAPSCTAYLAPALAGRQGSDARSLPNRVSR